MTLRYFRGLDNWLFRPSVTGSQEPAGPETLGFFIRRFPVIEPQATIRDPPFAGLLNIILPHEVLSIQAKTITPRRESARSAVKPGLAAPGEELAEAEVPRKTLGDYRIIAEVGRGGMGIVYEAEQVSLGRRVALKVLPFAVVLDSKQLQRFKNEAQAAAHLQHQNIVPVYSVGCERGVHYYAMQFIEGSTLADVIHELRQLETPEAAPRSAGPPRPTPKRDTAGSSYSAAAQLPDEAPAAEGSSAAVDAIAPDRSTRSPAFFRSVATLGVQAAEALEHAHDLGVVHRDIKPSNLLLDARGKMWIADFGLARLESDPGLTMTGDVMGTLRYMSPEQASGKPVLLDHRTDIYSLGVTLYELLTLKPAFDGRDRREMLRRIADEDPRLPCRLNAAIPADLETIVLKATAKGPGDRYTTAQAFADDLRRFLEDKPIQAKRPTLRQRAAKWSRRHRHLVASTAVLLVLAIVGLSVGMVLLAQKQAEIIRQRDEAQTLRQRAEANFQKARDAVDQMLTRVAQDKLAGLPQMEPIRRELLEDALEFYQGFLHEQPESANVQFDTAMAYHQVGSLRQELGDHAEAEQAYRESISLLEALAADTEATDDIRSNLTAAYNTLGILLAQTGRPADAESAYRRAIEIRSRFADVSPDPAGQLASSSATHSHLGILFATTGRMPEAEQAFRESLALMERLLKESPDELNYRQRAATIRANLGNLLALTGRPDDAETAFRQSIDVQRSLVADFPDECSYRVDLARSLGGLAAVLRKANRLDEADQLFGQTIALYQKLADDFPAVILYRHVLGGMLGHRAIVFAESGRLDEAERAFRQAIEVSRQFADEFPEMTEHRAGLASAYFNLSIFLRIAGKLDKAETALRETLALREALADEFPTLHDHSRQLATIQGELGLVLTAANRSDEAAEAYRRALTLWEKLAAESPDVHTYQRSLANLLADFPDVRLRDTQRAVVLAERAVELAPQESGSWSTLGTVHYRTGNWEQAVAARQESMRLYAGGDSRDHFFMAMAQWQLGDKQRAREWYDRGVLWMSEHHPDDPGPHRFRAEAAELLGLTEEASIEREEVTPED